VKSRVPEVLDKIRRRGRTHRARRLECGASGIHYPHPAPSAVASGCRLSFLPGIRLRLCRDVMDGWNYQRMTTMPTSDADRYAQLLQNLAVRIGAIREAIERAFGVTLPTARTLNAEFEIITSAIYAAADQPRPDPVIDDKPTTRTHFVYRIDIWSKDGKNIVEHLAGLENLIVARAAYRAACERWPNARITLRQGARVVEDSRR
jgi:hypothetical protein